MGADGLRLGPGVGHYSATDDRLVGGFILCVKDLVGLGENAVLTLDKRVEDPVELYVGGTWVARGQLEEMSGDQSGQLAVRLTEISDLQSGLG